MDYQIYEYAELYNLIMTEVCHGVRATNYRRRSMSAMMYVIARKGCALLPSVMANSMLSAQPTIASGAHAMQLTVVVDTIQV